MHYQFVCQNCHKKFVKSLLIIDRNKPISEPCPNCNKLDEIIRDYNVVSFISDLRTPYAHAKKKCGSQFTDIMERIHKNAGKNSKMQLE